MEALDEDKVKLLAGFHKQIIDLNERCVKPLVDSKPNCTYKVLSPYNNFDLEPIPEITEIDIFAKEQTDNLVNAFHSHPQIKIAIDSASDNIYWKLKMLSKAQAHSNALRNLQKLLNANIHHHRIEYI